VEKWLDIKVKCGSGDGDGVYEKVFVESLHTFFADEQN
jgi:hypothetical protein